MAIGEIEFTSRALSQNISFSVILPGAEVAGPGPYPVLLQLHGRFGGHRDWLRCSKLAYYVQKLPLIVVMPDGADHMWSNMYPTIPIEDMVMVDLREQVEAYFPVQKGAPWAVGGLSMGGFGAMRLGLKYPDKFCSVYAHSSPVHSREEMQSWPNKFTPELLDDLDLHYWAERAATDKLPSFGFDCGLEDQALEQNRGFHRFLEELGLPHQYLEHPGDHNWDYWDLHILDALRQHADIFGFNFS